MKAHRLSMTISAITSDCRKTKETGFYTPYWTQLSDVDKQQYVRVFKKNEVISTDLNTDVGSIKAKLLARGDGYGTYQDLESEEAYDRISGCTMMETEAQVSALLHNIVTKINDAYCPNKTVDTDVTYTDADGNQVSLKGKKVLDAANCAVGGRRTAATEGIVYPCGNGSLYQGDRR